MSGLVGNPRTLSKLMQSIRSAPVRVQERIAAKAAPIISELAQGSFAAKTDPYGQPWVEGVNGKPVDLEVTGKLKGGLRFTAVGRRLRAVLGAPYSKYQIGKRRVLPPGGKLLPTAWSQALADLSNAELAAELKGASGG